jgi:hypothetical protein
MGLGEEEARREKDLRATTQFTKTPLRRESTRAPQKVIRTR